MTKSSQQDFFFKKKIKFDKATKTFSYTLRINQYNYSSNLEKKNYSLVLFNFKIFFCREFIFKYQSSRGFLS